VGALLVLALAALFGAGDQYLGSMSWIPWAADVSLLSAPWLVLAFVAGWTQSGARRAALLGFGCTACAFAAYGVMTLSPLENAQLTSTTAVGFLHSEARVLVGGVLTGPLFGWFGQQWRTRRAWLGAIVTAGAVILEPLARIPAGREIRFRTVWIAEVAVGVAMAGYVAVARTRVARSR
jgi:Family of unknown function (DUF6518)